MTDPAAAAPIRLVRIVPALGVAQIVSWGSLFYAIAVLGEPMRRELGVSEIELFGSFTAGLLASGAVAPLIGRTIDARGGRRVLATGSALGALACLVLGTAQGFATMFAGWLLAGLAMAACLYDPAFAALHRITGPAYRRSVTALTLFGGFASTVFWPLAQFLLERHGWRATWLIFAALHLLLCLPLHLAFIPGGAAVVAPAVPATGRAHAPARGATFAWLATALALATFVSSSLSAHLIGLLRTQGLTARDAVLVGSLIGPMQVAGRVIEYSLGGRMRAFTVGTLAFTLLAASLVVLALGGGIWIAALAFALAYGWSNGVMTIVRGTVPAELFGQRDYGTLLGRLARPQFFTKAIAPVALTLLFALDATRTLALWGMVIAGIAALAAYQLAIRAHADRFH